jgi:hypothetical protein
MGSRVESRRFQDHGQLNSTAVQAAQSPALTLELRLPAFSMTKRFKHVWSSKNPAATVRFLYSV